jgi:hypothetical protein
MVVTTVANLRARAKARAALSDFFIDNSCVEDWDYVSRLYKYYKVQIILSTLGVEESGLSS